MILLKLGAIKGESKIDGHTDWITVDSITLGASRAVTTTGAGGDRDTSNPSFSEISMGRNVDKASAELWMQAVSGKSLGKAEIHFVQTTDNKTQVYMVYELGEAIVTSHSLSSGGERPTESFTLNFTTISMQYNRYDGTKVEAGTAQKWDVLGHKKM